MKRMRLLVVVALALVLLPSMVMAVTSGVLYETGTSPWDGSPNTFDTVMEVISGNTFSQPFTNMTAGWTAALSGDQLTIVATGPVAGAPLGTTFNWTEHYVVDSTSFTVAEYLFSGGLNGKFLWGATYDTNTGNLVGSPLSNPVPIPPSALLLGSGILGLVGLGWRRRKTS